MTIDLRLSPGPQAPAEARRSLDGLGPHVDPRLLARLRLLVSELVTNSVRHAGTGEDDPIYLRVDPSPGSVRVEVVDKGDGFDPPRQHPDPERASGWGLFLVDRIADRWGVRVDGNTRVWFELDRR
jgi:anti-sigma regulatory factor (Ser/Thr protein kinase)